MLSIWPERKSWTVGSNEWHFISEAYSYGKQVLSTYRVEATWDGTGKCSFPALEVVLCDLPLARHSVQTPLIGGLAASCKHEVLQPQDRGHRSSFVLLILCHLDTICKLYIPCFLAGRFLKKVHEYALRDSGLLLGLEYPALVDIGRLSLTDPSTSSI